MSDAKPRLALVIGTIPTVDEIDQFRLIEEQYDINVISSESICGYLTQTSYFKDLTCIVLPDYDENPTYLPGLEKALNGYDMVLVKERIGLYAYQCVKAKWRYRFRLLVWVDNVVPWPANDVDQMRTVRMEVSAAADAFIVQSKAARTVLELEGIEKDRIHDMLPWVGQRVKRTKKTRAQAREALGLAEGDLVIAYTGQIEWEEGLQDLVAAVKLCVNKNAGFRRRVRVVFCGIGSWAEALRESFLSLGIDDKAIYLAPNRKSMDTILAVADAIYLCHLASRDRVEGDPYRLLSSMVHEIPVVASRSPIVEEYCGKHRLDFCPMAPATLARSLLKIMDAEALKKDIVRKNSSIVKKRFGEKMVRAAMTDLFEILVDIPENVDETGLDNQVLEVETRVANKQYVSAVETIETIFQRDDIPVHHRANLFRLVGDCFAKLGEPDEAKEAYMRAADLDPYSARTYIGLGTIGLVKNSYDIGVLHFQKAVSLAPDDEMASLGLGLSFQGMAEHKEAIRWVNKALSLNPMNSVAIYTLVKIAHEDGAYDDAIRALNTYLERHPNDFNMVYSLAGIYYKMGRFDRSIELLEKVTEVDPMEEKAQSLLKDARNALEAKASSSAG